MILLYIVFGVLAALAGILFALWLLSPRFRARMHLWWVSLPDQWKATLRTAAASLGAGLGTMILATIAVTNNVLVGGSLEAALDELELVARAFLAAVLSAITGVVTFWMNRNGRGARYDS